MKQQVLILLLAFLPTITFGQKKYKHEYREYLKAQESTYTSSTIDAAIDSNKALLSFEILDNKGEAIPFVNIIIDDTQGSKTLHTDLDGKGLLKLPWKLYNHHL